MCVAALAVEHAEITWFNLVEFQAKVYIFDTLYNFVSRIPGSFLFPSTAVELAYLVPTKTLGWAEMEETAEERVIMGFPAFAIHELSAGGKEDSHLSQRDSRKSRQ